MADSRPDRQPIDAPLRERVTADYRAAMYAAANYAWANRQAMTQAVSRARHDADCSAL